MFIQLIFYYTKVLCFVLYLQNKYHYKEVLVKVNLNVNDKRVCSVKISVKTSVA